MIKENNIICPICNGSGNLPETYSHRKLRLIDKKVMANLLRDKGYSIREIMRFLQYKSPRSVHELVKKI